MEHYTADEDIFQGCRLAHRSNFRPSCLELTSRNPSNHQLRYGRGIHLLRGIYRCGSNGYHGSCAMNCESFASQINATACRLERAFDRGVTAILRDAARHRQAANLEGSDLQRCLGRDTNSNDDLLKLIRRSPVARRAILVAGVLWRDYARVCPRENSQGSPTCPRPEPSRRVHLPRRDNPSRRGNVSRRADVRTAGPPLSNSSSCSGSQPA